MSLSNALLAFLLFGLHGIKYKSGEIEKDGANGFRLANVPTTKSHPKWLTTAKCVILRHGTRRDQALIDVGCRQAINFLKNQSIDSGSPIYPTGWWGKLLHPNGVASSIDEDGPLVEFVPPLLRTHATTFVSTLASVLQGLIDRRRKNRRGVKPKFRVCLHRLTRFDGQEVFQQVTPYKGRNISTAGVGRFFPVLGGVVGLACRTGSLVVAVKKDSKKFSRIWELTDFEATGAKNIRPYVDSLLCCPFFAPETVKGHHKVILALFVDSADSSFFGPDTRETISAACRGFVELLESLHDEGMLRVLPSSDTGYKVPPPPDLAPLKQQLMRLGVEFVDTSQQGWKESVTFKKLQSVDLQLRYQDSPT